MGNCRRANEIHVVGVMQANITQFQQIRSKATCVSQRTNLELDVFSCLSCTIHYFPHHFALKRLTDLIARKIRTPDEQENNHPLTKTRRSGNLTMHQPSKADLNAQARRAAFKLENYGSVWE